MTDPSLPGPRVVGAALSPLRLSLIRGYFLLDFVLLGAYAWSTLLGRDAPWPALDGVAFSFWAAVSLLSGLGLRYPQKMLPVLFVQLAYKLVWLLAVAAPMALRGHGGEVAPMARDMAVALALLVAAIPWRYALHTYLRAPAEPWRGAPRATQAAELEPAARRGA